MKKVFSFALLFTMLSVYSCDHTLRCERHYITKGFLGKVVIYFNVKNGQNQYDYQGCIVYHISEKGECFSAFPYKEGTAFPKETFKYFEVISKDSLKEIFEFEQNEYLQDTLMNKQKKYVFLSCSGFKDSTDVFEYFVDYGKNYFHYLTIGQSR